MRQVEELHTVLEEDTVVELAVERRIGRLEERHIVIVVGDCIHAGLVEELRIVVVDLVARHPGKLGIVSPAVVPVAK